MTAALGGFSPAPLTVLVHRLGLRRRSSAEPRPVRALARVDRPAAPARAARPSRAAPRPTPAAGRAPPARPGPESQPQRAAGAAGRDPAGVPTSCAICGSAIWSLPVAGHPPRAAAQNTFDELARRRRVHEAIDILAPRDTPVLAVEDGTVAKLFTSKRGRPDHLPVRPDETYAYYYAHLERYADGLKEGDALTRGQVIGYVGTSGNAPPDTPHLHFAIFRLTEKKRWWEGAPIDPFLVLGK